MFLVVIWTVAVAATAVRWFERVVYGLNASAEHVQAHIEAAVTAPPDLHAQQLAWLQAEAERASLTTLHHLKDQP